MKMLLLFWIFLCPHLRCQEGFQMAEKKKTVIPFRLINNLIFIPVTVNGVSLTFLLDTGVSETILFSLDNAEVNFKEVEKIKFSGLGENLQIEGLKAINNTFSVAGQYTDRSHTLFIILDEGLNFSSHVGIPVNGIIGYHFFKNHLVEINFITKKITILPDKSLVKKKKYEEFTISLELNKPYLSADVEMIREKKPSKLLLDLGNSDALWLFPTLIQDFVYNRPNIDDYLGRGFNGDIYGKRSRIHGVYLGKFKFDKPLTAMPDEYSIQHLKLVDNRKGSVGGEILRRFHIIFDYTEGKLYLRKNKHYNDPFLFNKSGLEVQHDGLIWQQDLVRVETKIKENPGIDAYNSHSGNFQYKFVLKPQYSVAGCRKESPCDQAGLKKDDKILSINRKNAGNYSLEDINTILKSAEGKLIEILIERNSQKMKKEFVLRDPIPYQETEN